MWLPIYGPIVYRLGRHPFTVRSGVRFSVGLPTFMRTWIEQPPKSRNCGQIAVAVLAGVSLEESIKAVGKKGSTTTKQLAKGLRALGYQCPDRCKRVTLFTPPISLAIGQLRCPKRSSGWHWVVLDGDKIYDGIHGKPNGTVKWDKCCRITSYLPVTKI